MPSLTIGAVVFDAVGTLIHPEPSAVEVYEAVGRAHGSRITTEEIKARFRAAFAIEEAFDRERYGLRTSESREVERWRNIVAHVLSDVDNRSACFEELYQHFAKPKAWRCAPQADRILEDLAQQGLQLGLASNYDRRLHAVLAGLSELRRLKHIVISSEVGWRKPALPFFEIVCAHVGLPPGQVLFVGDDPINDYEGARTAGLGALLVDPLNRYPQRERIDGFAALGSRFAAFQGHNSFTLFAYGTLRRGQKKHELIAGEEFLGVVRTSPRYRLYDAGEYPCLVEVATGGVAVAGELWRIREGLLPSLDAWEGAPDVFVRGPISVEGQSAPVTAYFYRGALESYRDCGDVWHGCRTT